MRVLVVEDDEAIRRVLTDLLSEEGYKAVAAGDGLALLHGAGFVRRYRAQSGPHAPIVLMTAGGQVAGRAAELGVDAYLGKPFDVEELLALVARFDR